MTTKTINQEFEQCHKEMDLRKDLEGEYRSDHTDDCYRSFLAGRVSGISYCSDRDKARVDTKDAFPAYTRPPAHKAITADMVTDEMVDAVEDAIGMGRGVMRAGGGGSWR